MLSKTRTTIIALAATLGFAGASLAPAVAQAQPVFKAPRPGMKGCTLKIGANYSIMVEDEAYVEVRGASGKFITLRCKNGVWYEEMQAPTSSVINVMVTNPQALLSEPQVVSSSPATYLVAPVATATLH